VSTSIVLIVAGACCEAAGYSVVALQLRQTRRRLRDQALPTEPLALHDVSPSSDSVTIGQPTLAEQVTWMQQGLDITRRRVDQLEEHFGTKLRQHDAALAAQSGRPLQEFAASARATVLSLGLFIFGVALSAAGAINSLPAH
jgi:hypothetical protein